MPLDAIFLTALKSELDEQIIGLKIDKIQQPEQDQLLLTLRGFGVSRRLLISAGTGDARLHFTGAVFENPMTPPMFCMLLRKHLTGAKIVSVSQSPFERAIDLALEASDAMGAPGEKHLILELLGRYSNIILTGADGRIIDCLRRVDGAMSEKRQVLPGLFYHLPPAQDKQDPLNTQPDAFLALLQHSGKDTTADKWLLETFGGFSPVICREIVNRAYGETAKRISDILLQDGGNALAGSFTELTAEVSAGRFLPCLLLDGDDKPFDFSYTPVLQYGGAMRLECLESFSALLETFYTRRFNMERMRQRSQTLNKNVRNAHDRVKRKLENQREELKLTFGRERLKELGDLITANFHVIKKGMTVFTTQDYYSEDCSETEIKLEALKTPQQNAAKYYKDYTKAKTAENILTEQVRLGETELEYLKSVLEEINRAENERDLAEIKQELTQTGYIKVQKTGKKEKQAAAVPMRFVSSTGLTIYVGKNNVQNDVLTNKMAFKTDIWLHAQKIPGSHVIISLQGKEPDATTLDEAAKLAAYFSQTRDSKKVPVDYTLLKHVKKIPGGRPGMVTYTDYKTIIAQPSEELVKKLKVK